MDRHRLSFDRLQLDPQNPRLPEGAESWSQREIFAYLAQFGVLDEIVESMLDNGYFEPEPLVVLREDADGNHVVVEGNRRLAALMAIHNSEIAEEFPLPTEPTAEQRDRLREIPCLLVDSRDEVVEYIGFRHIGGLKQWRPEAKARYVIHEVDRVKTAGHERPFYEIGRRVGSNAQGIRNSYIAMKLLMHARAEGLDPSYVIQNRFGVWVRCMNSQDIRGFIEFGSPRTYDEVTAAVSAVNIERLREVIQDLSVQPGQPTPLLADSRDVTAYGSILRNEKARRVLRRTGKLATAKRIISQGLLPERIKSLTVELEELQEELADRLGDIDPQLTAAAINEAQRLLNAAKIFRSAVQALAEQSDDE